MICEIKSEAALGAEKFAVETGMIAIIGSQDFVVANAESGFATVRAMGARRGEIGHLPRARLIAISAAGERADGADIDAHAAFFASQFARLVWKDYGLHAARSDAQGFHVHTFIARTDAAEAENAARRVVVNERRPFFLGVVELFLNEARLVEAVTEGHILQFALATFVAHWAIEGVIRQEELNHVLAGFVHLIRGGFYNHAIGSDERAGGLQLRHFFDFDQAHAASGLERVARVIAERRDLDALGFGGFNYQSSGRGGHRPAVD